MGLPLTLLEFLDQAAEHVPQVAELAGTARDKAMGLLKQFGAVHGAAAANPELNYLKAGASNPLKGAEAEQFGLDRVATAGPTNPSFTPGSVVAQTKSKGVGYSEPKDPDTFFKESKPTPPGGVSYYDWQGTGNNPPSFVGGAMEHPNITAVRDLIDPNGGNIHQFDTTGISGQGEGRQTYAGLFSRLFNQEPDAVNVSDILTKSNQSARNANMLNFNIRQPGRANQVIINPDQLAHTPFISPQDYHAADIDTKNGILAYNHMMAKANDISTAAPQKAANMSMRYIPDATQPVQPGAYGRAEEMLQDGLSGTGVNAGAGTLKNANLFSAIMQGQTPDPSHLAGYGFKSGGKVGAEVGALSNLKPR